MKLEEVLEIQNALNPTLFFHIKNICMNSLNWAYINNSAYGEMGIENDLKSPSFSNVPYIHQQRSSELTAFFESALMIILDKVNMQLVNLKRIRIGMMIKSDQNYINDPHIDDEEEHITALLYLNTCNAPTILYDKFYDKSSQKNVLEYIKDEPQEKMRTFKQIPSIENNVVIFNGYRYHSSTIQTDTKQRIVVNFNFTIA